MGILISRIFKSILGDGQKAKIVIVGLNNAGKTTILYRMHTGQAMQTQPTIASNVEEVKYDELTFQVWDLGGQEDLRAQWSSYFSAADAVIFVVDSHDQDNSTLAKMEFFNVLLLEDLKNAYVLVLANKQDIPGSRNPGQIAEDFGLNTIRKHEWHIQGCCALTGDGLKEGFGWIANKIKLSRKTVSSPSLSDQTIDSGSPQLTKEKGEGVRINGTEKPAEIATASSNSDKVDLPQNSVDIPAESTPLTRTADINGTSDNELKKLTGDSKSATTSPKETKNQFRENLGENIDPIPTVDRTPSGGI